MQCREPGCFFNFVFRKYPLICHLGPIEAGPEADRKGRSVSGAAESGIYGGARMPLFRPVLRIHKKNPFDLQLFSIKIISFLKKH